VGRTEAAALDITRVHRLAPRSAEIPALEAVIAVAQGRKEEGLRLARTAIERDSASIPAHIAL
jgi:hypothetical protein